MRRRHHQCCLRWASAQGSRGGHNLSSGVRFHQVLHLCLVPRRCSAQAKVAGVRKARAACARSMHMHLSQPQLLKRLHRMTRRVNMATTLLHVSISAVMLFLRLTSKLLGQAFSMLQMRLRLPMMQHHSLQEKLTRLLVPWGSTKHSSPLPSAMTAHMKNRHMPCPHLQVQRMCSLHLLV